jgi:hypothetical protein
MLAVVSYDKVTAEFSTWLRVQVWNRLLKEYVKSIWESEKINKPRERFYTRLHVDRHPIEILDNLSEDSINLILMVYQWESEFDEILLGKRSRIKYVFRFLRELGWSRVRIHRCFKDLGKLLK